MNRTRMIALPWAALAAVAAGPILGAAALAAEPTVVVRPGDTLSEISVRHDVAVAEIVALNRISDPNRIFAGQRLRLSDDATAPSAGGPDAAPAEGRMHVVRSGENLTWIARRYGVSVAQVVAANGITDAGRIYAGQRLVIPSPNGSATPTAAASSPAARAAERTHTVQSGENLTWIARRYGVSVAQVVAANGITDAGRIYAGQRLVIPGVGGQGAGPTPMPKEMAALVAERRGVGRVIREEASRFGVPASLALALAWQESGWQQGVVSGAGAIGVMQLLPATGEWVGATMLHADVRLRDTRSNVRAGVRLLAHYLDRYDGSVELTLAAYYQGQRGTDRHGVYPVSRPYIASVKSLRAHFED